MIAHVCISSPDFYFLMFRKELQERRTSKDYDLSWNNSPWKKETITESTYDIFGTTPVVAQTLAMNDVKNLWDPQSIPEIKEVTIYYSDMINGIKVQYRKCGKFKHKQPASANTKKKTLKLRKGECINKVLGRADDYVYQLELRTSLGQSLIVGEEKGELKEPELP